MANAFPGCFNALESLVAAARCLPVALCPAPLLIQTRRSLLVDKVSPAAGWLVKVSLYCNNRFTGEGSDLRVGNLHYPVVPVLSDSICSSSKQGYSGILNIVGNFYYNPCRAIRL